MSRPRRSDLEKAQDGFRKEIRRMQGYLNLMSQRKLADRVGIPQSTLSKKMADPGTITVREMRQIVAGIHPDPRAMLLLLGYDQKDMGI